jgi:prepilin-type processing-associated H-X9-DG protein/prepilin-type N-terminal cleavage/methylation domain-containing protein
MSRRRAFTLVELLVVVAILSILLALLLPAISRARQQALCVKCAGNLRTMGQALTMYTTQYNYYPGGSAMRFAGFGWTQGYAVWPTRLRPLTGGNTEVFHCPSRPDEFRWEDAAAGGPAAGALYLQFGYELGEPLLDSMSTRFSYAYNEFGTSPGANTDFSRGLGGEIIPDRTLTQAFAGRAQEIRANRVKSPSRMIAIADGNANGVSDFILAPFGWFGDGMPGRDHLPASIHGGGCNVLFCDGHVQWYAQRDLTPHGVPGWRWPDVAAMWNNDNRQ